MAREGLDVGGTGRNKSSSGPAEGRDGGGPPRRGGKRRKDKSIPQQVLDAVTPSGRDPGLILKAITPGLGVGTMAVEAARNLGLEVTDEQPPEGRDGAAQRRRRQAAGAGDTPLGPLTGSADEDGGEAGTVRRRPRTVLGAANVRRPMLGAGAGRTFLGR